MGSGAVQGWVRVVMVTFGLGGLLYLVTWILCGIAALSAIADGGFRYPWTLRLIK